jgi:hypothetical protein
MLVMCPKCRSPLWINELEQVGPDESNAWMSANPDLSLPAFIRKGDHNYAYRREAVAYATPTAEDYFSLLEKGIDDLEKERGIRLQAWWAKNDARRSTNGVIPMTEQEERNLASLGGLLDKNDYRDVVVEAEVMRELARFDDALAVLEQPIDERVAHTAEFIRILAAKHDRYVREIK